MKGNRTLILIMVWLLVMVSVVASTATLLASDGVGTLWVGREEKALLERYARLEQVRSILSEKYYQEVDDDLLMEGAIRGMMAALEDPYTFYYTPGEMEVQKSQSSGEYKGVGMLVQGNDEGYIEVIRVYEGGPADATGLLAGDILLKVEDAPVYGATAQLLNEAVALLKGEDGSSVTLTADRGGAQMEFTLIRGDVHISNVAFSMLEGHIGYIAIFQFSGNAVEGFQNALDALQDQGAEALIVDVRNNPGGVLDDVVDIADALLGEGCVVTTRNREGGRRDYYSDGDHCDLPLAVLANGMSASASEILAAAVQDHERGTVIGEKTYGKGIVQTLVTFEEDGAGMQYTSECYFTPDGKDIHGVGVTPDVEISAQEGFSNYTGIPDPENDLQLRAAMELLRAE